MPQARLTPSPLRAVSGPTAAYTEFTPATEAELVYRAVMAPDVWYAVGRHVDGEALRDVEARLLMQAARLVHARGVPVTYQSCVQELQLRVHSREMAPEELGRVEGWFDRAEAQAGAGVEALVAAVSPVLRQRARACVLQAAIARNAIPGDTSFADLGLELDRTDQIGNLVQAAQSVKLDEQVWSLIDQLHHQDRLSLGIPELDDQLDGGPPRGGIVTIGGDPGDGKSVFLTDVCVHSLQRGLRCVYFSLEMGAAQTMLRVLANLTGEPQAAVARCDPEARRKYASVLPTLGPLHLTYLAQGSTVEDVEDALETLVKTDPRFADGWDVCFVDYGDLMGSKNPADNSDYHVAKTVWAGLRGIAAKHKNWMLTASQLKDVASRTDTVGDYADSKHKGRITDCGLVIKRGGDSDVRQILGAKYRDGRAGWIVGPLIPDFARGRFHDSMADAAAAWAEASDAFGAAVADD